jgi:aminoglycoside/choline kinase family phosphotransferase
MQSAVSSTADPRADLAREWALAQLALPEAQFAPASADASFRRYFRITGGARSWVVMDAPPEREDSGPFVAVAGLLRRWGINAPEILAQDRERGFLLLTDLGTQTFLQAIQGGADAAPLFADALAALVQMQARSLGDEAALRALPAYDAQLLWREVRLFSEWYLPRHLGVTLPAEDAGELERAMGLLVKSALMQPRCFVHRDFMPRNLMLGTPGPGVLDFQDAVLGPVSYDPVCLYKDAFWSAPAAFVHDGLQQYWTLAREAKLPVAAVFGEFWRQAEWMGVQRHLKVLGIFARLSHRDGKPHYAADTPRFVRYVMEVATKYPELAPLAQVFERHVLPRVEAAG